MGRKCMRCSVAEASAVEEQHATLQSNHVASQDTERRVFGRERSRTYWSVGFGYDSTTNGEKAVEVVLQASLSVQESS